MRLQEIRAGQNLSGVEPTKVVKVVATVPQGDGALQLIYRTPDGGMKERLLLTADEQSIDIATFLAVVGVAVISSRWRTLAPSFSAKRNRAVFSSLEPK
jgi:hypothetical protein